jgi:hypothetical protein
LETAVRHRGTHRPLTEARCYWTPQADAAALGEAAAHTKPTKRLKKAETGGGHFTAVRLMRDEDLTPAERLAAGRQHDNGVP